MSQLVGQFSSARRITGFVAWVSITGSHPPITSCLTTQWLLWCLAIIDSRRLWVAKVATRHLQARQRLPASITAPKFTPRVKAGLAGFNSGPFSCNLILCSLAESRFCLQLRGFEPPSFFPRSGGRPKTCLACQPALQTKLPSAWASGKSVQPRAFRDAGTSRLGPGLCLLRLCELLGFLFFYCSRFLRFHFAFLLLERFEPYLCCQRSKVLIYVCCIVLIFQSKRLA